MSQTRGVWIASAIPVFVLAVLGVMLGVGLMPRGAVAIRNGTLVPWLLTWGLIWITTAAAIVIALLLAMVGAGRVQGAEDTH